MRYIYLGFRHVGGNRQYTFQHVDKSGTREECTVSADLALFPAHAMKLQDGVAFCLELLSHRIEGEEAKPRDYLATATDFLSYQKAQAALIPIKKVSQFKPRPRPAAEASPFFAGRLSTGPGAFAAKPGGFSRP